MPKPSIWQQQQQTWKRRKQAWPTKVTLHWSIKYSAYALKFHDTGHWDEMQPFFNTLKANPYGEYMYDPDDKIWYFDPKHLNSIQALFDALKPVNCFEVDFQQKPDNQTFTSKFVSVDTYIDTFNKLSGSDIKSLDFTAAKKMYFKTCMKLHPDKGHDPKDMTDLNVAWDNIKELHYKIQREVTYDN